MLQYLQTKHAIRTVATLLLIEEKWESFESCDIIILNYIVLKFSLNLMHNKTYKYFPCKIHFPSLAYLL